MNTQALDSEAHLQGAPDAALSDLGIYVKNPHHRAARPAATGSFPCN
jgi:hypothetical protein